MSKSVGKRFEENFKASVPYGVLYYRPPDQAQSFNMNENSKIRFSRHSPCDCLLFNGEFLFTLELKTVFGTSITFERTKNDKGVIHYYQVESLKYFSEYNRVVAGFMIDFRGSDNTYFLSIKQWDGLVGSIEKKSFNENDLLKYASPIKMEKKKLKVNYRYDIEKFLNDVKTLRDK